MYGTNQQPSLIYSLEKTKKYFCKRILDYQQQPNIDEMKND